MRSAKWLVLLGALLSLTACVPVVLVGAAGGGVLLDKESNSADLQTESVKMSQTEPDSADVVVDSQSTTEVQTQALEPEQIPKAELISQNITVEASLSEKQAEENLVQLPESISLIGASESYAISELVNRGWKVRLNIALNDNVLDGVLYFDANQNFYGFDGCRYFRGKYQAQAAGDFLINSLMVSSKGSSACGNEITKSLLFVDSFKLSGGAATLLARNAVVMTLNLQDGFDAKTFLSRAKFKNRKRR